MDCIINNLALEIEDKVIADRRNFHKYPELGWMEFKTASLIARRLIQLGYEVKMGKDVIHSESRAKVPPEEELKIQYDRAFELGADQEFMPSLNGGYTGVVGMLNCGEGPEVALRFDMDALRVQESEEEDHFPYREGFASIERGVMHACGHDGHMAIGLGVAEILCSIKATIKGRVKLIFQPAEEGVRGAQAMVKAGVLDGVDYLVSGHLGLKANRSEQIICGVGGFLATSKMDVLFKGKAGHAGASPESGNNALLSAVTAALNLHAIPRNSQGITRVNVGKLISGTSRNIIPDSAYMEIETRGETTELNDYMKEYAERILYSAANMHGVEVKIDYVGSAESAESDNDMIERVKTISHSVYLIDNIRDEKINLGASEDISCMMNKVQAGGGKAVYVLFGSDIKAQHHNSSFDFNEKDLIKAVRVYSNIVFDILHQ